MLAIRGRSAGALANAAVTRTKRAARAAVRERWRLEALRHGDEWLSRRDAGEEMCEIFGDSDDELWLWLHLQSRQSRKLSSLVPGLPDAVLQSTFTGSVDDTTMLEGGLGYRVFRDAYRRHAGPITGSTRILDFGCGWGRIIRYFLKDVPPGQLRGVDIGERVLDASRRAMPGIRFDQTPVLPPSDLEDESFELIYAYSVFSHLSERAHDGWVEELHRVLTPGGVLVVTTWPRSFIEHCARLRDDPHMANLPASHLVSARAFLDTEAGLATYDRGDFCFSHRGGNDPPDFGEACLSERFVLRAWAPAFEIREFIDDRRVCPQNVIVARKPV